MGNLLWGLARLAEHPGDEFIRAVKEKCAGIMYKNGRDDNENEQAMTNVLWALCVFDELDPGLAAEVRAHPAQLVVKTCPVCAQSPGNAVLGQSFQWLC